MARSDTPSLFLGSLENYHPRLVTALLRVRLRLGASLAATSLLLVSLMVPVSPPHRSQFFDAQDQPAFIAVSSLTSRHQSARRDGRKQKVVQNCYV